MKSIDMTKGKPIKVILMFAIPLFIGNIFQQVYNMVDTMIAGYHLGDSGLAAIGSVSTIYSLLLSLVGGMCSGFGVVIARKIGGKNKDELRQSIESMIVISIGMMVVITIAGLFILNPLMRFLSIPDSIFQAAKGYIGVIIWGVPVMIFYNMCSVILRSHGNSKTPLLFLMFASIINIILDVVFVVVFKSGAWGIGVATVIAQAFSGIFSWRYIKLHYNDILPKRITLKQDKGLTMDMLGTGLSMAIMLSVFSVGSVVLSKGINHLGEIYISAHTAARKIVEIFMQPLGSIASASTTFISQNLGAGKIKRVKQALRSVVILECCWAIIVCILSITVGRELIILISGTTNEEIIHNATVNLLINGCLFVPLGFILPLRTAMQAMGAKVVPIINSCIELFIKIASVYFVIPKFGYLGASLTEPSSWVICMIFLLTIYIKRKNSYLQPYDQA